MSLINVDQYPIGTVVEASKTEGFTTFVTGKIDSQWASRESYEQARLRTGEQFPSDDEWLYESSFLIKYYQEGSTVPSYFVASYARLPQPTSAELFGLLTRIENILTEPDPGAVMRSIASLITDKDDLLVRLHAVREKLKA